MRLAVHSGRADPDHKRAIMLAADAGARRPGPDPDGDPHHSSVVTRRLAAALIPVTAGGGMAGAPGMPIQRAAESGHCPGGLGAAGEAGSHTSVLPEDNQ